MDKTIKKYWLTMPDHRLRTHLYDTLKFPPDLAASLIERVGAMREERRAKAIKQTICAKAWEELLTAPRAELGNIRTMKAQLKREGGALPVCIRSGIGGVNLAHEGTPTPRFTHAQAVDSADACARQASTSGRWTALG